MSIAKRHATRRRLLASATGLAAMAALPARAQWPERSITLLVSFPPGGSTDVAARLLAPPLTEALGRPVVVENRGGAGGNIGITAVARAAPDGYTFLVTSSAFVVNPSLSRSIVYDPARDFAPITTIGASPNVFAVLPNSEFRDMRHFMEVARARPDQLNYASPGVGTTPHLAGEVLKLRTGIAMQHVGFSGAGPATQAALAGTVQMISANQGSIETQLRSGQFRPIAQTGATRAPGLETVPTLGELGIQDAESETFIAMLAPAAVPAPVLEKVSSTVVAILRRPEMQERFRQAGLPVVADGPDGLRSRIAREVPLWRQVVQQARITVE